MPEPRSYGTVVNTVSAAPSPETVTYFEPQPGVASLPQRLTNPFVDAAPPPLARSAAEALQRRLLRRELASAVDLSALERPGGGKMFGVLVVAVPDGRVGYLCGFSGMLGQRWEVEGFVPPLFDAPARDSFFPDAEAELDALGERHAELLLRGLEEERRALEHRRAERSRELWRQLAETYRLPNARGETLSLGTLFAPEPPPGGAGDCAAPKLLGFAFRHGLRPLGLAEFWWGAPPLTGERRAGGFYPACHRKCGRVLPYMLQGLELDGPPLSLEAAAPPPLRTLYEDAYLLVVDKPSGLPCVPGRHSPQRDSVLVRLKSEEVALSFVQALDTDASGVLLLAKDDATLGALHRQLARGEAHSRFVACLDGAVKGDGGEVALRLRTDPDDRLRQCVDPERGQQALTRWRVLQRSDGGTRVELVPRSARPHQLRVHAAHPLGLGVPIRGDRLYGQGGARLLLHAEALHIVHPRTGERLLLECPAPF
jgi:tRNA pseudouridine32 synthase / 23S rRNA pseudouridine746 synthase